MKKYVFKLQGRRTEREGKPVLQRKMVVSGRKRWVDKCDECGKYHIGVCEGKSEFWVD